MNDQTTGTDRSIGSDDGDPSTLNEVALVIIFSREPGRIGEVFLVPVGDHVIGRGPARDDDPAPRPLPIRQRPGSNEDRAPLDDRFISRVQIRIFRKDKTLAIENVGRGDLISTSGRSSKTSSIEIGECFAVSDRLALLCIERPRRMPRLRDLDSASLPEFGRADDVGAVGESVSAWALRDSLAFLAGRSAHVLLLGPSGSGKEIAAQAIHRASVRKGRPLVARNAATIPTALIEAELFGHAANYPNSGMHERHGIIGEAAGSTLFLDEIGELSEELQTRLLRVLDSPGEYQRLGESRRRTADVRVIGATNRGIDSLREDLAARLKLRLHMVGLNDRRDDIPLLAKHLLRKIAHEDKVIASRFFESADGSEPEPRMSCELIHALVTHRYATHIRELESLLWTSISQSRGSILELPDELEPAADDAPQKLPTENVTAEMIREALERSGGSREEAWRALGLANRHVLKRLIKKHGL